MLTKADAQDFWVPAFAGKTGWDGEGRLKSERLLRHGIQRSGCQWRNLLPAQSRTFHGVSSVDPSPRVMARFHKITQTR